ncbi:MAG: helix-turn-helix domain-containing protein [Kiritimatiellae bacterium]|nr:helix-turn-helix domain-containing protein [Kiritimatiellia bacterium]
MLAEATRQAVAMLLRADRAGDEGAKAGLLALLGEGPGAVPADQARSLLRLVGRRGAVMSPRQSAAVLGCSRATLYRWRKEGRISIAHRHIGPRRVGLNAAEVAAAAAKLSGEKE